MKKYLIITAVLVILFTLLSGCSSQQLPEDEVSTDIVTSVEPEFEGTVEKVEEAPASEEEVSALKNKIIAVDAGHGKSNYNKQEPIAPNSSQTKIAFASGTSGENQTEEQLNLKVALKLQKALTEKGAEVHMTRTTAETDKTNVDRAVFANELNADISVKIHADGSENSSIKGISVLVPEFKYITDENLISVSRKAGELVLEELVMATGANNRGISPRTDLTGFNWSTVPIILVEMGFMTNPEEDKLMETEEYQDKIVQGIVKGLERHFAS